MCKKNYILNFILKHSRYKINEDFDLTTMLSERENYYSTKIFEEFNKFYQSELLPIHKFESFGFVEILSIFRVTCSLDTACGIYKDFFTHPIEFLDLGFSKMIQWFILKNILVQQHKV